MTENQEDRVAEALEYGIDDYIEIKYVCPDVIQ
jgi:hypothetical protein